MWLILPILNTIKSPLLSYVKIPVWYSEGWNHADFEGIDKLLGDCSRFPNLKTVDFQLWASLDGTDDQAVFPLVESRGILRFS